MAAENPTWGEERIANELMLKLGIRVRPPDPKQHWLTFVHNHARAIVAAALFVVITATFRTLYVFVILELGTRRILHPQRHRPSDGGMDDAPVPRRHSQGNIRIVL